MADAIVHIASIALCVTGSAVLLVMAFGTLPIREITGLAVYAIGMIGMFSASASYNLVNRPELKAWLRRIDHSVIFVMIAGSYTPFALKIGGTVGFAILILVWVIAALGIFVKMLFPRRLDRLSVVLYLAQGWCVVFALGPLMDAVSPLSFGLLLAGGIVYSAGVIFHLLERMPFHNVVWHVFVLAGAALQYGAIYEATIL